MQEKISITFLFKTAVIGILTLFCLPAGSADLSAQPVLSADNMALGSGGTAWLSGFEAALLNPANLAIPDHEGRLHAGFGHLALSYEPIISTASAGDQFSNFKKSFYPYATGENLITGEQRAALLAEHFAGNDRTSQHQNRADLIIGGFLWQNSEDAFSVVLRTRLGSRIEMGRGWYESPFQNVDGERFRDFTLKQQKQQLYEFSFGYGREFTLINGLIPRLSKLYVGIAPKLIVSGRYHELEYNGRYSATEGEILYSSDFSFRSTGEFSRLTGAYLASSDPDRAISGNLDRSFTPQAGGYGIGFDFGFTWLIPLGDKLPTESSSRERSQVTRSLRVAFSLSDIGFIRYSDQPLRLASAADSLQLEQQGVAQTLFTGAGGEYLGFFEDAASLPNPFKNTDSQTRSGFSGMLPTSVNAGLLFELNRLKMMGDLTLGLDNSAFTSTKLAAHLGLEIRPHRNIPLRMGTRMAAGSPINFGFGTGYISRYWDFTIGTQIIMRSRTLTSEFAGGAFAGLQLHF